MGTDPMGLGVDQILAEEDFQNEQILLDSLSPDERARYEEAKQKANREALSVVVGAVPVAGDIHDATQVWTGRDYVAGDDLSDSDRAITLIGLALPAVGAKVVREVAGSRPARWLFKEGSNALEGTKRWLRMRRQLRVAERLGVLGVDSVVGKDLVRELADLSTHGSGDRLVIGRYLEGNAGSFEQIAQKEGGVYYSLSDDTYEALGKTPEARKALADAVNERVLLNQMASGVDRIEFVTEETYDEVLKAIGKARRNEVLILQGHAEEYGYIFDEDNFVWIKSAAE